MAALLAMKKHSGAPDHAGRETPVELETRISKATAHVQDKLQHWDVEASMHVGFEILVPALLSMLEQEKIYFTFPGQQSLATLNERKLWKFDPRILYGTTSTTLLHSLEAFVGKVDFNQVIHHKTFGSMMASPSSTAAYLMNCSSWDVEAEMYIRNAITHGGGNGSGGLPSAFPCNIFELTWVASTLLQGGFSVKSLGDDGMSSIGSYVEKHFHAQDGLLGF
ncbi:MAG: hypothetical protein M1830_004046, partial [Pleopsidium flavum]